MPLRIALAGAGMVTQHHLRAWKRIPGLANVVAIADPDAAKARARAAQFAIPAIYSDVREMLTSERPDAIDIASPVDTHVSLALQAASAGVHVLVQKPFAADGNAARSAIADLAGRVRVMVHENWRFRPQYRALARWLQRPDVGAPRTFRYEVLGSGLLGVNERPPPALVRQPFLARMPRLLVYELLIHHLDVLRFLLGKLEVRGAWVSRRSLDVVGEDTAEVLLAGESAAGSLYGSLSEPEAPQRSVDRLKIVCANATIRLEGSEATCRTRDGSVEAVAFDPDAAYQSGYDEAIRHFARALVDATPMETDVGDNVQTLELVDAVYRAAAVS